MNNFIKKHLKILSNLNFLYPEIELRALLNKSSHLGREVFLSNLDLDEINIKLFKKAFSRRIRNEPLSKIFNQKDFMEYCFYVNKYVLDPRPETEIIIDNVTKYYTNKKDNLKIADLGTGSGCLAISLVKIYKNAKITATDISNRALAVAKKNAKKFNVFNNIDFYCCNWIKNKNIFDIVVSNPPYLSTKEYLKYLKKQKKFEPKIALWGGVDGLLCYKKLSSIIPKITNSNSLVFIEIGFNQKNDCIRIFEEFGMYCIEIIPDYQNFDRILVLKKKNN